MATIRNGEMVSAECQVAATKKKKKMKEILDACYKYVIGSCE